MLNIVIPMAGAGSRFAQAGYVDPKPMIKVHGKPMISVVVENIRPKQQHRFIFIVQREHISRYDLENSLLKIAPGSVVIAIDGLTDGAACTVLKAKEYINNDDSLMIANSDQWVDVDINAYLEKMDNEAADGLIMTMKANDPKWSYVKLGKDDVVTEVVEKKVVSDEATVGIYNYRSGSQFVRAAESMIEKDLRVNNEFYVAPAYDQMIQEGAKVVFYNIGSENSGMHGLGIPSDLESFVKMDVSLRATSF